MHFCICAPIQWYTPCKDTKRCQRLLEQSYEIFIRCRGIIVDVKAISAVAIFPSDVECQRTERRRGVSISPDTCHKSVTIVHSKVPWANRRNFSTLLNSPQLTLYLLKVWQHDTYRGSEQCSVVRSENRTSHANSCQKNNRRNTFSIVHIILIFRLPSKPSVMVVLTSSTY